MKKLILFSILSFAVITSAQEFKQVPMVTVSGEGKIKVVPDQVNITMSVESKGNNAIEVKKENDTKMDAVLKFIKKMNLLTEDYHMQRVSLNPSYDNEKKKHNYIASQTLEILLKDLSKYDVFIQGLVETGVNRIENVQFKFSKMLQVQSDCRRIAIKDAKSKAEDFVLALGQKVGKALSITDNSQGYNPQPFYDKAMTVAMDSLSSSPHETLAAGLIEIVVNVNVSFSLK